VIVLTPAAAREIRRLQSKQDGDPLLWVRVTPGGCADFYYDLSFKDDADVEATAIESEGIRIAIDPDSQTRVRGLRIDYSEDLMGGGFRFSNPNAIVTCGCGNSFSTGSEQ